MFYKPLTFALLFVSLISVVHNAQTVAQTTQEQTPVIPQKNSTKKIRVKPSAIASRIGTAVNWETDFDVAMAKSSASGRPVFWYVSTLRGTFMDRKKEIDRYMLSGPLSWPVIIEKLNKKFVCIKTQPTAKQQKRYNLVAFKFVEPGIVVLTSEGKEKLKVDRITTLHPVWFNSLLSHALGEKTNENLSTSAAMAPYWTHISAGNWNFQIPTPDPKDADGVEKLLISAMARFRNNDHAGAKKLFEQARDFDPKHPLSWKAAAEAEGFGPFVRGFEILRSVPSLNSGIASAGSAAPIGTYTERQVRERSVDYLLGMQTENGGYVDSDYDFGGTDGLPNVHVAVTSLCGLALLSSSVELEGYRGESVERAIKGCVAYVTDDNNINVIDRDEIMWAYAYRVRFLARLIQFQPELMDKLNTCVRALENVQSKRGGWYHEYENPFVTATALAALSEAKIAGASIDTVKIESGLSSLLRDRNANGSFPYSSSRGERKREAGEPEIAASAGRMPLCELGLYHWGRSDDQKLAVAVTQSFKHHDNLNVALKYDDHTSRMAYGGFFFWYDMRARTEAIGMIADRQLREKLFAQQKEIVMTLPEIDGCFVDSHELGRCYGTAMAILCLSRIELDAAKREQ